MQTSTKLTLDLQNRLNVCRDHPVILFIRDEILCFTITCDSS